MTRPKALPVLASLLLFLAVHAQARTVSVKLTLQGDRDVKKRIETGIARGLADLKDAKRVEKGEDCEIEVIAFNIQSQGGVKLGYAVTAVFLQPFKLQGLNQPIRHFLGVWTQTGPYESLETHGVNIARYYAKNIHPALAGKR